MPKDDVLFNFQQTFKLSDTAMQFLLDLMTSNGIRQQDVKEITYDPLTNEFTIQTNYKKLAIMRYWLERIMYI